MTSTPARGRARVYHRRMPTFQPPSSEPALSGPTLQLALDQLRDAVLICGADGRIEWLNAAAGRVAGLGPAEAVGRHHSLVLRWLDGQGRNCESPLADALAGQIAQDWPVGRFQLIGPHGLPQSLALRLRPDPRAAAPAGLLVVLEERGREQLLDEELAWRARHDLVTGLPNRDEFERQLQCAALASPAVTLLCMLDIDRFRLINDVLGHTAGDELMQELAGQLRARLRSDELLARLSGDEFGVLLRGRDQAGAEQAILALLDAVRSHRFLWRGREHAVTVSVGVAPLGVGPDAVGLAMSAADAACYAAKQAGRDCARWMGLDAEAGHHQRQMDLVGEMGRALEDGRLFLFAEDVVSVADPGRVMYRELLVRLRMEDGTLIEPSHFIPAAERYSMMRSLDRWVVRQALAGLSRLRPEEQGPIHAINLSAQSIGDPAFLDEVLRALDQCRQPAAQICFEITETAAVSRLSEASRFCARLRERGCKFALDDFGVGLSNFGYLKNFPVDFLKIDGSFVRSMRDSRIDLGLVASINRIGHDLGLKTIAEHVETPEQLLTLRQLGVDWAQGRGLRPGRPFDQLLT